MTKPTAPSHEDSDVELFRAAVRQGDVTRAEVLLGRTHVRARVNDPAFDFGQRATHLAARNEAMLKVLLAAGADINLPSDWTNGPYTVLDNADDATARFLIAQGATLTLNVAARLGWLEQVQAMVTAEPSLVHSRGGDGQQPLHEAKTVAIADLLIDHGADLDARCIDHQSTPAQYALVDRPSVCRRLLERGATPDIFMAARFGDAALATRLLDADASSVAARISEPGYPLVPPCNIYCWSLGFGLSARDVAARFGHHELVALLDARSPARIRLLNAVTGGDEAAARSVLAAEPALMPSLTRQEHAHLALAIFHERFDAAELMLRMGFDPSAGGVDGGSALHAACWVGNLRMVELILAQNQVPLDARDPTHGSTLLGWAAFGSINRRARGADYVAVIDRLVSAGADVSAIGNRHGHTLLQMSHGNPDTQAALRRHGAG